MPHKQGGNNKVCQAHPPLHTVYAAVGCGTRTAGRFGLSSCHNSPLVRHFTRVSLLCEKILGYEPIIHGMDRNASTPLQKQAARALPYPCRGSILYAPAGGCKHPPLRIPHKFALHVGADARIGPRASNAHPYPFFTRRWHRSWTARGRWGRRRCSRARPCWASSNPRSSPPGRDSTFQKFHGTAGFPW